MKAVAKKIRLFIVFIFILILAVTIADYAISAYANYEYSEELAEDMEEHDEYHEESGEKRRDCYQCESNKRNEKMYKRNFAYYTLDAVEQIALYSVYCGILWAITVVIVGIENRKKTIPDEKSEQPQPIKIAFCHNCGNSLSDDSHFCGVCGTIVGNK